MRTKWKLMDHPGELGGFFYGVWAKGWIRDQKPGFSEWIKSRGTVLQTAGFPG